MDGNANDETPNANHGTVHGATVVPGKFNEAYDFDGVNDYIAIPKLWSVSPSEVTVEAWVKTDYVGPDLKRVFYHGHGGELALNIVGSHFEGAVKLANGSWYTAETTWTPSVENWYYLALVWRRNEKLKLFVNGELEAETAVPNYALYNPGSSYPARIGCYGGLLSGFWDGVIDEIRVSRIARTADEIKSYFESGLPFGSTSTSTLWHMDYPSGGNYWSDYVGVDNYRGENQDQPGSDGMGDTPYYISGDNNRDRYPLISPWAPTPPVIPATIGIKPDTLNLKSRARWITTYIELPPSYSVGDIDVGTVMLLVGNGNVSAEPKPTKIGDHDHDGIPDLKVRFDRGAVQVFMPSPGEYTLTIRGEVAGVPFEGSKTVSAIIRS